MSDRRRTTQGSHAPSWRSLVIAVAAIAALAVYLFVSAPPLLAAEPPPRGALPIQQVFEILEREHDAARALWTQDIVEHGLASGLAFDEHWRDAGVHAGPLPALFLRETARHLERTTQLGLFLGSPFPINKANLLTGQQAERFTALAVTGMPQQFFEPATARHTAMFPDRAITRACATCHNEHADSPKHDWAIDDVMGATTWMYPDDTVTAERALELVGALRASVRKAYAGYLAKVATFPDRPAIGARWPRDGFYLPAEDVFMRELARRASSSTLDALLDRAEPGRTAPDRTEPSPPIALEQLR